MPVPRNLLGKILGDLLAMLFLKSAPQDLPYSLRLTLQLVILYVFSGLVVLQSTLQPDDLYFGILLGLLIQFVFAYTVLAALNQKARFLQTLSAMLGVGILFNFLSWPVFSMLADEAAPDSMKTAMSLLFLMLMSWEVLVKAHIFKHALEMKMFGSLALSFSLFFISITLSQLLLPAAAGS